MSVSMSNDHGGDVAGGNKFSTFVNLLLPACPTTSEGLIASASQVTAHGGGWGWRMGSLLIILPVESRLPVALQRDTAEFLGWTGSS